MKKKVNDVQIRIKRKEIYFKNNINVNIYVVKNLDVIF